jgi:hypothetical protein
MRLERQFPAEPDNINHVHVHAHSVNTIHFGYWRRRAGIDVIVAHLRFTQIRRVVW